MLTETFGIASRAKSPMWKIRGVAAAMLEAAVRGHRGRALELATLVFMDMEEHPDGDVELKGDRYPKHAASNH